MSKNSCPSENNYDSELDHQIKEYFKRRGYHVVSELTSTGSESIIKSDIITTIEFGNVIKMFGIQVKRPNNSGSQVTYRLDSTQHSILSQYSKFIAYAFPDCIIEKQKMDVILHHTKFSIPNKLASKSTINSKDIRNSFASYWGYLADKIIKCEFGLIVNDKRDVNIFFSDMRKNPFRLFFIDLGLPQHNDHRYK